MPFFDFHLHPSLKPQMSLPPNFPSPWDIMKIKFAHPNIITALLKCSGINDVVDSQASLTQLIQGKVNLIAIALHPPETNMMNDGLIQEIAKEEQTQYINIKRINSIGTGDHYFEMINDELKNLTSHLSANGKQLKIIGSINEYNAADTNTIHALLNVEGAHAFYGIRTGKSDNDKMTDFWNNFESFTDANRIFALNIAHLQDNDFCNHAFGIQIFKPKPFYPKKNGITPQGFRLLHRMKEKKILADIKHTSLFARNQLYAFRHNETNWPIVCTHAGLTGIKKENRGTYFIETKTSGGYLNVKHYKPRGYLAGTSFNPSSINLYDEDVKEIIFSDGLIGLSMDQRILGTPEEAMMSIDFPDEICEEEVISPGEKDFFRKVPRPDPDENTVLKTDDLTNEDRQDDPRFHARHFMNHVFHLFVIADRYNINKALMAQRICIGSDFDGLINPIKCCRNVTEYESFKAYLLQNFAGWEDEFAGHSGFRLSGFITPADLLENIFYRNAVSFLQQWYV